MAEKKYGEVFTVLSGFLDEKSLDCLKKDHKGHFELHRFVQDLIVVVCDSFAVNSCTGNEDKIMQTFATHVSNLFPRDLFLDCCKKHFEKSARNTNDNEQCFKICVMMVEIIKRAPIKWILQSVEQDCFEISDFEKEIQTIAAFLLSFVKEIDLMTLKTQEVKNNPKSRLVSGILPMCQSLIQKFSENSVEFPENIMQSLQTSLLKNTACPLLLATLQYSEQQLPWSSISSTKTASDFLQFFLETCKYRDLETMLCTHDTIIFNNGLFGEILQSIKCYMSKEKLVELPVVVHVLVFCVKRIHHPYLGQHLSMLIPPLLLLIDDFRVSNRVTAIKTLQHLIINTNATELCWYGRADVIYEALHHCIYTNESEVMTVLQPCLLEILKVIEDSPKKTNAGRKMSKCDENFQSILTSMEFESKIAMRRAYCTSLVSFIDYMGITVLKHFKRLLRVVVGYLEISDCPTEQWRLEMFDVLKAMIRNAWPRIPKHSKDILKCLLKLLLDISFAELSINVKKKILVKIEDCMYLLLCCCGDLVKVELEVLLSSDLGHKETQDIISTILQTYNSK